jgi:hypothetical protein
MLVFIDESGDPGFKFKKGSTPVFTAASVAFHDHKRARITQAAIESVAARLQIRPKFKFSKYSDEV